MYKIIVCRNMEINELHFAISTLVTKAMEILEKEGFHYVDYVSGQTDMVYTVERI